MSSMASLVEQPWRVGWVKAFFQHRGYGFIIDVATKEEIFVHFTSLQRRVPGYRTLWIGEYVEFTLDTSETARKVASKVRGILGGPLMCEAPTEALALETVEWQREGLPNLPDLGNIPPPPSPLPLTRQITVSHRDVSLSEEGEDMLGA